MSEILDFSSGMCLIRARMSSERLRESAIAAWLAVIATGLWLAAPLFGTVLLVPLLWMTGEGWRLRAFLIFQIPVAAFNFAMLRAYYGQDGLVNVPGLGMLIIGLQIESWACLDMLALRKQRTLVTVEMPGEVKAVSA